MTPRWHALYGFVFSIILIEFFNFSIIAGLIVFSSSILLDIDHYLLYLYKDKRICPIKAVKWNFEKRKNYLSKSKEERRKQKLPYYLLHGVEFLIPVFILSFFFPPIYWVFLGIALHLFLDYIELMYYQEPLYQKFSQIFLFFENKRR